MKFHVHTPEGVIVCDALNPKDARDQVRAVHPGVLITKVKLAGGQKKDKKKNA